VRLQPRYYVVRIYGGSGESGPPAALAGAVEDTSGRRWAFRTAEELVRILEQEHRQRGERDTESP